MTTASAKFYRIADKLRLLEDLIAQVEKSCAPYADELEGYGGRFIDELDAIIIGLRLLSGEILTQEEMALISQGGPDEFLRSSNPTYSELEKHGDRFNRETSRQWGFEEDYIDTSIEWAEFYLRTCRGYITGVTSPRRSSQSLYSGSQRLSSPSSYLGSQGLSSGQSSRSSYSSSQGLSPRRY